MIAGVIYPPLLDNFRMVLAVCNVRTKPLT
jgi:hypothetical protein